MATQINYIRKGQGNPLLLIHGLGGSWNSWSPILETLSQQREVIAMDLPGHGKSPRLKGKMTISRLADSVSEFLVENNLIGIEAIGSSMGGRIVMELTRRCGIISSAVALNPGGFWSTFQKYIFFVSLFLSIRLLRVLKPALPKLLQNKFFRSLLLFQFSAHPSKLDPEFILQELNDYINNKNYDELLKELAFGETQKGSSASDMPLLIVWGKQDRVCLTNQSKRAKTLFPESELKLIDDCGHFPQWDQPTLTTELIQSVKIFSRTSPLASYVHEHFQQESHV